jgi:hypothetical protein
LQPGVELCERELVLAQGHGEELLAVEEGVEEVALGVGSEIGRRDGGWGQGSGGVAKWLSGRVRRRGFRLTWIALVQWWRRGGVA